MKVKAGDLLGYSVGNKLRAFDFGVYNSSHIQNFINKKRFETIEKFIHADCPFDYFPVALKDQFYDLFGPKPLRQPKSCRGARGISGTIAEPWFDTEGVHLPAFGQTRFFTCNHRDNNEW